ncbi:MAG: hypothetical protein U5L75_00255 [Candidatus Campbellbacteria bacterium]|nr:hypothetical protein [Candidatus Campbellbacteria bacterium]
MAEDNQESTEFVREAKPGSAKISKGWINAGAGIIAVVLIVVLFSALFSNDNGGQSQETREARERQEERERLEEREAEEREAARLARRENKIQTTRDFISGPWIKDGGEGDTIVYTDGFDIDQDTGELESFARSGATQLRKESG